jgi:hypothetical protein
MGTRSFLQICALLIPTLLHGVLGLILVSEVGILIFRILIYQDLSIFGLGKCDLGYWERKRQNGN